MSSAAGSAPILFDALRSSGAPCRVMTDALADRVPTAIIDQMASIHAGDPKCFLDDASAASLLDALADGEPPRVDSPEIEVLAHFQRQREPEVIQVSDTESRSPMRKRVRRSVTEGRDAVVTDAALAPNAAKVTVADWADWAPTVVIERMLSSGRRDPQEFLDPNGTTAVFDALEDMAAASDAERSRDLMRFIIPATRVDVSFMNTLLIDVPVATAELRILAHIATAAAIPSAIASAATDVLRHLAYAQAGQPSPPVHAYDWVNVMRRRQTYVADPFSQLACLHLIKDILLRKDGDIEPAASTNPQVPWRPNPGRDAVPAETAAYLAGRRLSTLDWGDGPRGGNVDAVLILARMYLRSAVLAAAFTRYGGAPDNFRRWAGVMQRHYERRYGEKLLDHVDNAPPGSPMRSANLTTDEDVAINAVWQSAVVGLPEVRMLAHIGSAASIPDELTWAARAVLRRVAQGPHYLHRQARLAESRAHGAQVHSMEGVHRFTRLAVMALLQDVLTRQSDDIDTAGQGWRPARSGQVLPEAFRLLLAGRPRWHPDDADEAALTRGDKALRVARAYLRAGIPLVDLLNAGAAKRTLVTWVQGLQQRSEQQLGERLLQAILAAGPPHGADIGPD
ncbi:hypothetical protein [Robbsia sp. KACC 23696]|uniref:hypothetical protein n=1 Tax=Robbsia sp. KACC 23696 TaxID=3149231 RepID=UPI00325A5274